MKSTKGNQSVQPTSHKNPSKGILKPLATPPQTGKVRSLSGNKK